jgi:hypothetical protein
MFCYDYVENGQVTNGKLGPNHPSVKPLNC